MISTVSSSPCSPSPPFNLIPDCKLSPTSATTISVHDRPSRHSQAQAHRRSLSCQSTPELLHADQPLIFLPQTGDHHFSPVSPHKVSPTAPSCLPLPPTSTLVSLSFAQHRRDIRWRQEGFEMSTDHAPFAVLRSHTLVPLSVAYSRDDIRRRNEAFETQVVPHIAHPVAEDGDAVPPPAPADAEANEDPAPPPILSSRTNSTFGSIHSRSIYGKPSFAISLDDGPSFLDDTVLAVYDSEEDGALSLYKLAYDRTTLPERGSTRPENFLDVDLGVTSLRW